MTGDPHPLRACQLCLQHLVIAEALHCQSPVVIGHEGPMPCDLVRRPHERCGPDALHQDWPAMVTPP